MPDIAADTKADTPTIATALGAKPMLLVCGLLYAAAGVLSYAYLGWFSLVAAAVYVALMAKSYQALATHNLFQWYARFPLINSGLGMLMFFVVAGQRIIG